MWHAQGMRCCLGSACGGQLSTAMRQMCNVPHNCQPLHSPQPSGHTSGSRADSLPVSGVLGPSVWVPHPRCAWTARRAPGVACSIMV